MPMIYEVAPWALDFVRVEDAVHGQAPYYASEPGQKFGWLIDEGDYPPGWIPPMGLPFQGIHATREAAENAAMNYLWACRQDLMRSAQREMQEGARYRSWKRTKERSVA